MAFLFVTIFLLLFKSYLSETYPVCVIGGGISGLSVATLLQEKGYDVELFEATGRFGGKLDTYRGNSSRLEKGPIIFTDHEPYTSKWLQNYGMVAMDYDVNDHAVLFPNGGVVPIPGLSGDVWDRVCELTDKYKKEWSKYPASTWDDFGYSSVNFTQYPELAGSIERWLKDRGLEELSLYFIWFITIEGYGDIRLTPALYALKLISADNAEFFFELGRPGRTVQDGFDEFALRVADGIPKKWWGWEATRVQKRSDGTQAVTFNVVNYGAYEQICGKTILAFPPLYAKNKGLIVPMTTEESNILKAIKVKKFAASGLNIPSEKYTNRIYIALQPKRLNGSIVPQFEYPPGDGGLLALTRQDKDGTKTHFTGYSWIYGDYDRMADESDLQMMREKMDYFMQNVDPNYTLYFLKATDYCPHVQKDAILLDFFKGLSQIQGNGGIYWATTLLTFETINNSIEMAEKLVAKYF